MSASDNQSISYSLPTDLTIFDNVQKYPSTNCIDFKSCIAINRLLSALHHYSTLELNSNQNHQDIFTHFTKEIYKHPLLIQDFHHFQKQHDQQIHQIIKYAINRNICKECHIDSCVYASRHHRVQNDETINVEMDPYL